MAAKNRTRRWTRRVGCRQRDSGTRQTPQPKKRGRCSRSRPISNNWNQACSSHSKPDMSWNDPAAGYFLFLLRSHSLLTLTAIHFVFVWGTKMARSRRIWWNWPNGGLPLADFRGPFYWRIFFCESQSAKFELAIIQNSNQFSHKKIRLK